MLSASGGFVPLTLHQRLCPWTPLGALPAPTWGAPTFMISPSVGRLDKTVLRLNREKPPLYRMKPKFGWRVTSPT